MTVFSGTVGCFHAMSGCRHVRMALKLFVDSRTYSPATLQLPSIRRKHECCLSSPPSVPNRIGHPIGCTQICTQSRWLNLPIFLIRASELARAKVEDRRKRERDEDALDLAVRSWAREQGQQGESQGGVIDAAETTTGPTVSSIVGVVRIASAAGALPCATTTDASTTAFLEVRYSRQVRKSSCILMPLPLRVQYVCHHLLRNHIWDPLQRKNQAAW